MKRPLFLILILFICLGSNVINAQNKDTSLKVKLENDSILSVINSKTIELNQKTSFDSIQTALFENQLLKLKSSPNDAKKEALLKQFLEVKAKEEEKSREKKAQIEMLRKTAKSFPVHGFFSDTLFVIYAKSGGFSAKDRAASTESRIKDIADNYIFHTDSLKVIASETTMDIIYGNDYIMSVSENDAIWVNSSKTALAKKNLSIIRKSIVKYKDETSFNTLAKEIGLALLVLFILFGIIYFLGKFSTWLAQKIIQQEDKIINDVKIKNYILFDATKQIQYILLFNKFLKWLLILVTIYVALSILFGIFPWTQKFSVVLLKYTLNPLKTIALAVWNYMPNLITIIVIVTIFKYVLKVIRFFKNEIERGRLQIAGFYKDWANPTYQIIRIIIFAFMLVVVFPYLPGSESPVFKGVSVFLGVLLTFGSSGPLSNVMAGLVLTYMRLFKLGDRVKIGEISGDIIEKSLLVTRIRTIKNEIISIPNSTVMSSHTVNFSSESSEKGLILNTTVTIGYDVPWKDMHQALINAAERTEFTLKDPKPFVFQTSLDDFYVSYQINVYTKMANLQAPIYSQLHQNIQDCCNEVGIEILSPHYRSGRDGNKTTIPENYLSKGYKAPSFRVKSIKEDDE